MELIPRGVIQRQSAEKAFKFIHEMFSCENVQWNNHIRSKTWKSIGIWDVSLALLSTQW